MRRRETESERITRVGNNGGNTETVMLIIRCFLALPIEFLLAFNARWAKRWVTEMKRFHALLPVLALVLLLPACTTHLQQKEQFLRDAGFRAITPSTPAQVAHVKALPQGHITQVSRKGKTLYMLADAKKNLLLVGDNARFEKYQQILYTKQVEPEKADAKIIRMEEQEWGPWDGFYGPYPPMMMY